MEVQDKGLGLGLRSGVGIKRIDGGRDGLVGAVMVACLVHAQRADVDKSFDSAGTGRFQQKPECLDIRAGGTPARVPQSPTLAAQLNTQSAPATPWRSVLASARSPWIFSTSHLSSQRVSLVARTRARTRCPRHRASSTTCPPTKPVAPVMKMVLDCPASMSLGPRKMPMSLIGDGDFPVWNSMCHRVNTHVLVEIPGVPRILPDRSGAGEGEPFSQYGSGCCR